MKTNTIIHADCLEVLKTFSNENIDAMQKGLLITKIE